MHEYIHSFVHHSLIYSFIKPISDIQSLQVTVLVTGDRK